METSGISALANAAIPRTEASSEGKGSRDFLDTLSEVIAKTNQEQVAAESETRALVSGEGDIVDTMIAISRAEVSMRFVVSLRNRALMPTKKSCGSRSDRCRNGSPI